MGITVKLYTDSDPTLPTTQNRLFSPALFLVGARSKLYPPLLPFVKIHVRIRCTALPDDLDCVNEGSLPASRRCHAHTDALTEGCSLTELWDDYGIVGDLSVGSFFFLQLWLC